MKALDGFLERPIRESGFENAKRDGGLDFITGRKLSREIDNALRNYFDQKQKMSVATNYFAIACPIMPSFLLGAFMLLDKLDNMYDKHTGLADEYMRAKTGLSNHLYIQAMRERVEMEKKKQGLSCSRPVDGFIAPAEKKKDKKKEAELMLNGRPSERVNGPQLLSKTQTDVVHKIVHKKMALEGHLEEMNKEQDFQGACRVSAQLKILDKKLKQLGC